MIQWRRLSSVYWGSLWPYRMIDRCQIEFIWCSDWHAKKSQNIWVGRRRGNIWVMLKRLGMNLSTMWLYISRKYKVCAVRRMYMYLEAKASSDVERRRDLKIKFGTIWWHGHCEQVFGGSPSFKRTVFEKLFELRCRISLRGDVFLKVLVWSDWLSCFSYVMII